MLNGFLDDAHKRNDVLSFLHLGYGGKELIHAIPAELPHHVEFFHNADDSTGDVHILGQIGGKHPYLMFLEDLPHLKHRIAAFQSERLSLLAQCKDNTTTRLVVVSHHNGLSLQFRS